MLKAIDPENYRTSYLQVDEDGFSFSNCAPFVELVAVGNKKEVIQ